MKMDKKMKACFTPHVIMHSLFGFGLGILAVSIIPSLGMAWLGLIICVAVILLDMVRKS